MFGRKFGMGPMNNCCNQDPECPIIEPTINQCVERQFCHEVKQV